MNEIQTFLLQWASWCDERGLSTAYVASASLSNSRAFEVMTRRGKQQETDLAAIRTWMANYDMARAARDAKRASKKKTKPS